MIFFQDYYCPTCGRQLYSEYPNDTTNLKCPNNCEQVKPLTKGDLTIKALEKKIEELTETINKLTEELKETRKKSQDSEE